MENIVEQLNEIFNEVLDKEDIVLKRDTTANDIEDWDSLNHIHLVVAFEDHFNVSFTSTEMRSWKTVGDIADNIEAKLKALS